MNAKRYLTTLATLFFLLALFVAPGMPVLADTTADVTITFTPAFVGVSDNTASYDFGVMAASSNGSTPTNHIAVTNTSTVQTDITIYVTDNWTGGTTYTHSNTATPGANTVGMNSNRGGTWGVGDVIVEEAGGTPNYIYENCPASTNFTYGIQLLAPTSYTDGAQKTNTVRISAVPG